jgi:hypothetical protein
VKKHSKPPKGAWNASTAFKKIINMRCSHEDAPKRGVGIRSSSKAYLDYMWLFYGYTSGLYKGSIEFCSVEQSCLLVKHVKVLGWTRRRKYPKGLGIRSPICTQLTLGLIYKFVPFWTSTFANIWYSYALLVVCISHCHCW